jgi:hypothetical protein
MSATNQNQEIDTLKITENADGSFQMEWNNEDPKWSFLNNLTSKEIQIIMEQAIKSSLKEEE